MTGSRVRLVMGGESDSRLSARVCSLGVILVWSEELLTAEEMDEERR